MNCPSCQMEVRPGDRFCGSCGEFLVDRTTTSSTPTRSSRSNRCGSSITRSRPGRRVACIAHICFQFVRRGPLRRRAEDVPFCHLLLCVFVLGAAFPKLAQSGLRYHPHRQIILSSHSGSKQKSPRLGDIRILNLKSPPSMPLTRQKMKSIPRLSQALHSRKSAFRSQTNLLPVAWRGKENLSTSVMSQTLTN